MKAKTVSMVSDIITIPEIMSEAEARQHIETIKSRFDDITALLLELDTRRGWSALGYKSIHQMIQAELKDYLNKSVSQIYRKLNDAKIRRELSQICEKIETIPAYKLEPLGKLHSEQWQDAWEEVTSTTLGGEVTRQHVQVVVGRRLQEQKQTIDCQQTSPKPVGLRPGDWVKIYSTQGHKDWNGLRGQIIELKDNDGFFGVDLSQTSGQLKLSCVKF